jgi:predicted tellurium resistance membrane protein TerC
MATRIALLLSLSWIMQLREPLFTLWPEVLGPRPDPDRRRPVPAVEERARDPQLARRRGESDQARSARGDGFAACSSQIAIIDIVFSLDSVITAVGLADDVAVMVIAIVLSVAVMMFAARRSASTSSAPDDQDARALVPRAGRRHADRRGLRDARPKGYIYFAMAFSIAVEMLNIRMRERREGKRRPVKLRKRAPGARHHAESSDG